MRSAVRLVCRGVRFEVALYRSLVRWVSRRADVPPGAAGFGFMEPVAAMLWAFIVLSAVELVVLHVVLPWETVRIIADVLGVWGLVWMLGLYASYRAYPHVVGGTGLRLRRGVNVDITVKWDDIASVRTRERSLESSRGLQFGGDDDAAMLHIVMGGRTNVEAKLHRPVTVSLPHGEQSVSEIRFFADDPRELASRAREHLSARQERSAGNG